MKKRRIIPAGNSLRNYLIVGAIFGAIFAIIEFFARINTVDPQAFFPLIARAVAIGLFVMGSAAIFETLVKDWFTQRRFLFLVLIRSLAYTIIISFWLLVGNGVWWVIQYEEPLSRQLTNYLTEDMYLINLATGFFMLLLVVGLGQINNLHRRRELLNFVLGRFHRPQEVDRIFCFIDLKGSTTIAEKLGHYRFAMFLKDYYSDITDAIRKSKAQIYQYVGDEIVLTWSFKEGLKNNNLVKCFFQMKELIDALKTKYMDKYGVFPEFKAGLHGGSVIVTWVGEVKKEIVFIGDVLNTTARIQEDCKRLGKDFLVSEELLSKIGSLNGISASFIEETTPRGKEHYVKLYSLEKAVLAN